MSSPSDAFECQWQPSRQLLACYALIQGLALLSLVLVDIPIWARLPGIGFCVAHAAWVLPRHVLLSAPQAYRALRCTRDGWQVYSVAQGWQAIELHPDSLALPLVVLLRFRLAGQRRVRSLCIARDSLARDQHRRLRVRLKFSRHRWAAAG
ncbi:protein YgfX [Pseudomonas sp. SG20056]|uniref:protein YgfX n=1 Tax=Pseudomonas sp. SG20056 TaxID=3074146 RepID=UPI00287F4BCE|nr:protein YgfX [Pseudomonas sp. SG20056]WNF48185.1 protein YgfX [Pseudomonas sp. SG20056]